MHQTPSIPILVPARRLNPVLTLTMALILGLAIGCTQGPDPGAATASAVPPPGELPLPPMAQDLGQMVQAQGTQIQNPQAQANQGRREDVSQARPGTTKVLPEPSSRHRRDWSPIGTRPQPHHHPPCCRCRRTASVTPTSPTTLSS